MRHDKRRRDIKSKLVAAICMLLVSSIMMVSTTYAWFTLSTAPEVTGINTSVGANGNLEMALLPADGNTDSIKSEAGDSNKTVDLKNVTWGNLVDLSDSTVYGLDKLVLFPSALNAATVDEAGNAATVASALLKTPTYGADGRVDKLLANTFTGTYTEQKFPKNDSFGVRAVGTASGMTDRQLAFRNARSAASTATAQAKNAASTSLTSNGASLANVALKKATAGENGPTFTQQDVASLMAIVNDLLGTESKTGILGYIEQAYCQYILAYAASTATGEENSAFIGVQALVNGANGDLETVIDGLEEFGVDLSGSALSTPIDALLDTIAVVEEAKESLTALTGDSITWAQFSPALYMLADTEALEINGIPASEVKDRMSELVNSVTGGLTVTMASGGGVYADIADHCGDYTASIEIAEVSYGSLTLEDVKARMVTASSVTTYLPAIDGAIGLLGAGGASGAESDVPITDMYGYVIDLAFKTNASESSLLLQTEAVDRIYSDNGDASESMGYGSSMTFKATTPDFSDNQVKELMNAIRIVFFVPGTESNTVLATAKLDVANAAVTADGIKANIYLYENQIVGIVDGEGNPVYKQDANGNYLDASGAVTTDPAQYVQKTETKEGVLLTQKADTVITALTQNTAHKVSVLVYLDGNHVFNEDVAATAATSMTGQMNLQFASSATLTPMSYTPLQTQGTAQTPENDGAEGGETPEGSGT